MPYLVGFAFSLFLFGAISLVLLVVAGISWRKPTGRFWRWLWLGSSLGSLIAYAFALLGALASLQWGYEHADDGVKRAWLCALIFGPFVLPGLGFGLGAGWGARQARKPHG